VTLALDLRPALAQEDLIKVLAKARKGDTVSNTLRKAGLSPAAIGLLREAHGRNLPDNPYALAAAIKSAPVTITSAQPIERAISSAGGIAASAVDDAFMLTTRRGVFVAGEMLDWDAPTGGYLLQASFATGHAAATGAIQWAATQVPQDALDDTADA
jgi:predicted flavoprotein YhiN